MIFLSGLAPPLGLCCGGDLCGQYLALSQDSKLVVDDISLVVWELCFGKVGGVISCLFGPVRGYRWTGPHCLPTPPVSASSVYAAIVCVRGLGSVCYIWSISPVLSFMNLSMLPLILSLSPPGGPEPWDHASGLPGLMTPCCPQSTWLCFCSSFNGSACSYGTLTCSPDLLFSTL